MESVNKKIKDIAIKAGIEVFVNGNDEIDLPANQKEFAKLIIKECMSIAVKTPCPYTEEEMIKRLGHTWDMACTESANNIKKHFEVKK